MKRAPWTPDRDAELARLFETMTAREVATALGLSLSAVENRIRRIRGDVSRERKGPDPFRPGPEQDRSPGVSDPVRSSTQSIARRQEKPVSPLREDGRDGVRHQPSGGAELPESIARAAGECMHPWADPAGCRCAVKAPAVHTSKSRAEGYLVVPDLQAPFQAQGALEFCERVRREFAIPKDNVLFAGDEADNFHGKGLDKARDPDAGHTPRQELAAAIDELKRWYAVYPNARLAVSNHGTRYQRRAAEAEISSQWMRLYREVIEAPPGWVWQDRWVIQASKHPFVLEHGHEGASRTEAKVLENGYSTVHGHFTKAQIVYVSNHLGRRLWGFCAAALIDYDTYAFRYAKKYPRRADNGVGVILDGGKVPIFVPYEEA